MVVGSWEWAWSIRRRAVSYLVILFFRSLFSFWLGVSVWLYLWLFVYLYISGMCVG